MDAFIVLIAVIVVICWACYRRSLTCAVYGIASIDILLRIVDFIARNIHVKAISNFFSPWPNSLLHVASKYTSGLVYDIISWSFVLLMIYFLVLTFVIFFKK